MAEALYRTWRPRSFGHLVGQEPVSRTLRNAVEQDRVAHGYLLCGPRGTGKTSTGRILAKAVNCEAPLAGEPCDRCPSCKSFNDGAALDLIEIDAASNRGIDEIRALRETAAFHPVGKRKVYLIDEVHMLTEPAFNALLKTLEEPPPHVIFILATTEPQRVPPTILSRCQRFNFRRVAIADVVGLLRTIARAEKIAVDDEGLDLLARAATGSLRDALNLLEQAATYHGRDLTADHVRDALGVTGDARVGELAAIALRRELAAGLGLIDAVRDDGADLRQFNREVIQYLRGLLLVQAGAEVDLPLSAEQMEGMRQAVTGASTEDIVRALHAFSAADFRNDPLSSLPLELALADCVLGKEREAARMVMPPRSAPAAARPAPQGRPAPAGRPAVRPDLRALPPRTVAQRPDAGAPAAMAASRPAPEPREAALPREPVEDNAPAEVKVARARWTELYNRTRQMDKRTGALLNSECDIVAIDDAAGTLTFGFRYQTHAERAALGDGGANLKALTEAVQQVFGKPYRVECRHDAAVIGRQRATSTPRAPLIKEALDLGARIVGGER